MMATMPECMHHVPFDTECALCIMHRSVGGRDDTWLQSAKRDELVLKIGNELRRQYPEVITEHEDRSQVWVPAGDIDVGAIADALMVRA